MLNSTGRIGLIAAATLLWVACVAPVEKAARADDGHWAFSSPQRPRLPNAFSSDWPQNPIDHFILDRLDVAKLEPAPEADPETLVRRVTFALTGLPPTPSEIDAYLVDESPDAWNRLVDRLLASPRYGEHMGSTWLDLARYADTHGYHMDAHREMWRWRDQLVAALNSGQPYDRFTIEQLAGDMLPGSTLDQQIASGFNRNTMVNFEAGAIPEEFLAEYAAERVAATSTVWLGLTMQCCRCHDHKYDPLTQRDFYRLAAFFNQVPEKGIDGDQGNAEPTILAPSSSQRRQLEENERQINELKTRIEARKADSDAAVAAWEALAASQLTAAATAPSDARVLFPFDDCTGAVTKEMISGSDTPITGGGFAVPAKLNGGLLFTGETHLHATPVVNERAAFESAEPFSVTAWVFPTTTDRMTLVAKTSVPPKYRGWYVEIDQGRVAFGLNSDGTNNRLRVVASAPLTLRQWQHITLTYDGSNRAGGVSLVVNGESVELSTEYDNLDGSVQTNRPLQIGARDNDVPFRGILDDLRIYSRQLSTTEAALLAGENPVQAVIATPAAARTKRQKAQLRDYYLRNHDDEYQRLDALLAEAAARQQRLRSRLPSAMVMRDAKETRPTFVLVNGRYDLPGERVTAGPPTALTIAGAASPSNRLEFARWLVDPRNPLTARVAVNRIWQQVFGQGLVPTSEDFGRRGLPPTHPELLDWLAVELMESGWDTKRIHALIVMSATFRQSSRTTPLARAKDPENRLLARGPRVRLSAESIRDSALAISGLLVEQQGGPPVFPYQPPGLWQELAYDADEFTAQSYVQDHGANLYRRSIYTFWKRSSPPPGLAILGAPSRETCVVTRSTSNTPLEALVLMNETGLVEAARVFAERVTRDGGETDRQRIRFAFRWATSREPTPTEQALLLAELRDQRALYRDDPDAASALLGVGESANALNDTNMSEVAAWTMVTNTLLCLDEVISRY